MDKDGGPLHRIEGETGLEPIDREECLLLLRRGYVGRLALVDRGRPAVFPVNYALDGLRIVVRTAPGTKLAAVTAGTWGAFEIDETDRLYHQGWSVIAMGPIGEEDDPAAVTRLEQLPLRPWARGADCWLVLMIQELSGRRVVSGR